MLDFEAIRKSAVPLWILSERKHGQLIMLGTASFDTQGMNGNSHTFFKSYTL
jgi:hypothetical protein